MASAVELGYLAELRSWRDSESHLSPADSLFLSDHTLQRYLRARGSVKNATDSLKRTMLWRAEHCSTIPACAMCERDSGSHCFLGIGWTASRCPVVYGSVPRAANYETTEAVNHFAQTLEKIFVHPASAQTFIWIFDMAGYSLRHAMLVRTALGHAHTFSQHYPERLEAVILLNPTAIWDIALRIVGPLIDSRTFAKIRPVHAEGPEALSAALRGLDLGLSDVTLAWIEETQRLAPIPRTLPLPLPPGTEGLRLVEPGPWIQP
jgi:hypothetical protein